jgi:hypothetical protein
LNSFSFLGKKQFFFFLFFSLFLIGKWGGGFGAKKKRLILKKKKTITNNTSCQKGASTCEYLKGANSTPSGATLVRDPRMSVRTPKHYIQAMAAGVVQP